MAMRPLIRFFLVAITIFSVLQLTFHLNLVLLQVQPTLVSFNSGFQSLKLWELTSPPELVLIREEFEDPLNVVTVTPSPPKLWELPTLLNLTNFTWLMNNPGICKLEEGHKNLRLMPILVHTARSHFEQREAIRRSFGSLGQYKNWTIRLVFLLGQADPEMYEDSILLEETRLLLEQAQHGDLVMGSFVDTYRNMTYKHLMGYKWILNFCGDAEHVLKIDDDLFINTLKWLDRRSVDLDSGNGNDKKKIRRPPDLYCHLYKRPWPVRYNRSKSFVSFEEWPDKRFPSYCSGWAYALTVDLIRRLYEATPKVRFLWIDDVYATGVLLEAVRRETGFRPRFSYMWGNLSLDVEEYREFCERGCVEEEMRFKAMVYVPRDEVYGRMMDCLWNKTVYDATDGFTRELQV